MKNPKMLTGKKVVEMMAEVPYQTRHFLSLLIVIDGATAISAIDSLKCPRDWPTRGYSRPSFQDLICMVESLGNWAWASVTRASSLQIIDVGPCVPKCSWRCMT